jgi:signal peptidase I
VNRRTLGCLFELLETFLLTLAIFLVIQLFVAQPYQVQQTSMENTLLPNQYVLVDKLTPRFDDYHSGDVVVFNPPSGWAQDPSGTPYIKRVVAIGGDMAAACTSMAPS